MMFTTHSHAQNLNRIVDSLLGYAEGEEKSKSVSPRSYLTENNGIYTLEVELPGVKKEDINISVESDLLRITANRKYAEKEIKYEREYHLSNQVDSANIKANNENGVLTLTLSRKPESKSKQIAIQ